MSRNITLLIMLWFWFFPGVASGQELMDLLDDPEEETEYVFGTFKTTRIVNGQSIENPPHGMLKFVVSHQFGRVNQGIYHLFGMDQATMRMGFEYGLTERLALSVGRSTFEKTYDGFVKYKLLRQTEPEETMPVSVSWFSGIYINSLRRPFPDDETSFSSRISHAHQLLIARKFGHPFSLQLSPTVVHKNHVAIPELPNTIFALGAGGRVRITNRTTFNAEYFYVFNEVTRQEYYDSFSMGFDIETGGHVFQLHFSNSQPMFERGFITETRGDWFRGDIYFGFNITRVFAIKRRDV
jgi:hypothetical protein